MLLGMRRGHEELKGSRQECPPGLIIRPGQKNSQTVKFPSPCSFALSTSFYMIWFTSTTLTFLLFTLLFVYNSAKVGSLPLFLKTPFSHVVFWDMGIECHQFWVFSNYIFLLARTLKWDYEENFPLCLFLGLWGCVNLSETSKPVLLHVPHSKLTQE